MRSKARNIGYILDSKDLSKNSRHKKLYGPNELMEQPNSFKKFEKFPDNKGYKREKFFIQKFLKKIFNV